MSANPKAKPPLLSPSGGRPTKKKPEILKVLLARPEVQLNVGIQNNMNAPVSANDGNSFEMVVVSDLEYLGLRERLNYEHHPDVRDVDARVVPEELSGH